MSMTLFELVAKFPDLKFCESVTESWLKATTDNVDSLFCARSARVLIDFVDAVDPECLTGALVDLIGVMIYAAKSRMTSRHRPISPLVEEILLEEVAKGNYWIAAVTLEKALSDRIGNEALMDCVAKYASRIAWIDVIDSFYLKLDPEPEMDNGSTSS